MSGTASSPSQHCQQAFKVYVDHYGLDSKMTHGCQHQGHQGCPDIVSIKVGTNLRMGRFETEGENR